MVLVLAALAGALLALTAVWITGAVGRRGLPEEPRPALMNPERPRDDLADLVEALPLGGVLVGPHDEVMKVNDLAVAMGLARGTRVGFPGLLDRVRQVRRTGAEYLGTVIRDRPPGMENGELSARVIPLREGHVLVMAEDEAATRRMDAVRRDFVANVSHELKTPIGAIGILAETIEAAAGDPDRVTHFARRLQRESARLSELVSQIIELSRLQSSDPMLNREVVEVEEVVDEAIGRTREAAEARRITLVRAAVPCVRVPGDRRQLIDAVVNLVQNAINYSDDNARVVVAATRIPDDDGENVEITVTDNGIGISQEDQERIFERFYRVDYGRSRESGGTGLGLSIVRHIALAHQGSVTVWSRPRQGSTFTLRLPVHQEGPSMGRPGKGRGDDQDSDHRG